MIRPFLPVPVYDKALQASACRIQFSAGLSWYRQGWVGAVAARSAALGQLSVCRQSNLLPLMTAGALGLGQDPDRRPLQLTAIKAFKRHRSCARMATDAR
jgi:hypothetical protein